MSEPGKNDATIVTPVSMVASTSSMINRDSAARLGEKRGQVNFGIGELPAAIADLDRTVVAGRRLGDRSIEGKGLAFRAFLEVYNHDSGNGQLLVQSVGQFQRGRRVDVTY